MIDLVRYLAGLAADLLRGRSALIAENALLRQQLIVAERNGAPEVLICDRDRKLGALFRRVFESVGARVVPLALPTRTPSRNGSPAHYGANFSITLLVSVQLWGVRLRSTRQGIHGTVKMRVCRAGIVTVAGSTALPVTSSVTPVGSAVVVRSLSLRLTATNTVSGVGSPGGVAIE